MEFKDIKARIGTEVSETDMVEMIRSQPIGTSKNDVRIRSGVLSFSFGPGGVFLNDAEERTPTGATSTDSTPE
ncbi:MAG TPA: hypothetical protein VIE65_12940 [Methylobacter sp.]|jgi:hypothetical protein